MKLENLREERSECKTAMDREHKCNFYLDFIHISILLTFKLEISIDVVKIKYIDIFILRITHGGG